MAKPRQPWTAEQIFWLVVLYPHAPTAEIAELLGRSARSTYEKANGLGLRKTSEYFASGSAGRLDGSRGAAARFRPGITPWNKGMKGWTAGGRSAETRFKKGRPAHEARNHKPIGSLRLSKDGYLERKVTDDPRLFPARRWVGVHRLVWEAVHGPVPAGHAVAFRGGQRTADEAEITLDRLDLVSRADKDKPMEIERARAIADVAQTIINSAKVEVDRMKISGGIDTGFLAGNFPRLADKTPAAEKDVVEKGAGYTVRQHRLKG